MRHALARQRNVFGTVARPLKFRVTAKSKWAIAIREAAVVRLKIDHLDMQRGVGKIACRPWRQLDLL